jgi:hypothetical protein
MVSTAIEIFVVSNGVSKWNHFHFHFDTPLKMTI